MVVNLHYGVKYYSTATTEKSASFRIVKVLLTKNNNISDEYGRKILNLSKVIFMKKNLVYMGIGVVLLVACVGLIYTSLDTRSNITENSSKVNNTSSINNSNINVTDNNTNNSTNKSSIDNSHNGNDDKSSMDLPSKSKKKTINKKTGKELKIPKDARLTYSQVLKLAKKDLKSYESVTFTGFSRNNGHLYWNFEYYDKKNNYHDIFSVDDKAGGFDRV